MWRVSERDAKPGGHGAGAAKPKQKAENWKAEMRKCRLQAGAPDFGPRISAFCFPVSAFPHRSMIPYMRGSRLSRISRLSRFPRSFQSHSKSLVCLTFWREKARRTSMVMRQSWVQMNWQGRRVAPTGRRSAASLPYMTDALPSTNTRQTCKSKRKENRYARINSTNTAKP